MIKYITHELRTPLCVTITALQLLEEFIPEPGKKYFRMAKSSCMMLESLIDDVLDLSHLENNTFNLRCASFKMKDLLSEIDELMRF